MRRRTSGGSEADLRDEASFEVEWPPVAARLEAGLRRRRVPAPMVEDLVQETGLRLFEIWHRVDPARELWPLALTIALNMLRDHIRADNRRQEVAVPESLMEDDTETAALARVELARVQENLVQLTAAQRSALLAEVGAGNGSEVSASATKMLRLRARKRLRALMDGASGVVAAAGSVAQRALRLGSASTLGEQLAPGASLAAGVFWAAALGGVGAVGVTAPSWGADAPARSAVAAEVDAGGTRHLPVAGQAGERRPRRAPIEPFSTGVSDRRATGDKRIVPVKRPEERRVTKRPDDRPHPTPEPDGVRVDEPRAKVGTSGYDIKAGAGGSAGGHTAHAVLSLASETRGSRDARGCGGVGAPTEVCRMHPKGGASAQVDDRDPVEVHLDSRGFRGTSGGSTLTGAAP